MKLRRQITIKGYIESDTNDTDSLLLANAAVAYLTNPSEGDEAVGNAYRSLVDLEAKLGPNKPVRKPKAEPAT